MFLEQHLQIEGNDEVVFDQQNLQPAKEILRRRSTGVRTVTTTAPQALLLLNSPFVMNQARAAAERALAATPELSESQRIERAFRQTLFRGPSPGELDVAMAAVGAADQNNPEAKLEAWQGLYQGLFGCLDYRYLD
jgi:hypothetical protein